MKAKSLNNSISIIIFNHSTNYFDSQNDTTIVANSVSYLDNEPSNRDHELIRINSQELIGIKSNIQAKVQLALYLDWNNELEKQDLYDYTHETNQPSNVNSFSLIFYINLIKKYIFNAKEYEVSLLAMRDIQITHGNSKCNSCWGRRICWSTLFFTLFSNSKMKMPSEQQCKYILSIIAIIVKSIGIKKLDAALRSDNIIYKEKYKISPIN